MADLLWILFMAFSFSFVGSIPPGTINLSVMQLALDGKYGAALRFALAAALIEYPYAYIALRFEDLLGAEELLEQFNLLGAIVMILLGFVSWWTHRDPVKRPGRLADSGFRKGVVISLLNPLAIPFWIGVIAFLKYQGWVELQREIDYHFFVTGVSTGTFLLLVMVALLSKSLGERFANRPLIRFLPAAAFLGLGFYALLKAIAS